MTNKMPYFSVQNSPK